MFAAGAAVGLAALGVHAGRASAGPGPKPPDLGWVIDGGGRTLMSGLCDAHTHFSWNNGADLDGLGTMPVEEHLLLH